MRVNKSLAAGLAAALVGSAVSVIGLAAPAQAATGSTAGLNGSPTNKIGAVPYNATGDITVTAVQDGADVDVTVTVGTGPNNPVSQGEAGTYRLDGLLRVDGTGNTRGAVHMIGTVGDAVVPVDTKYYPTGTTLTATIPGLGGGDHTFTLTDLIMDSNGGSSGGAFAATPAGYTGFDAWYNRGTTTAAIVDASGDYAPVGPTETLNVVAPAASITAVANGAAAIPTTHGVFLRAGDTFTVSSGDNDLWEPETNWRATLCTDAAGTACPPNFVEANLWAGSPSPYVPAAGAPTDAAGKILPTQITLATASTYSGLIYVKIYQGSSKVVLPVNIITEDRTVATTATTAVEGSTIAFTGENYYPGETVSVTTSAAGAASTNVVANATGAISGSVVANKVGTVNVVATGVGGEATSTGSVVVTAKPVVVPPKDTTAPVVKIVKPKKKKAVSGKAWRKISGTITDKGDGPEGVAVVLISKKGKKWQAFNGKKWVKAKNKAQAQKKAKNVTVTPNSKGAWTVKVKGLKKGKLTVKYTGTDRAGNKAAVKTLNRNLK